MNVLSECRVNAVPEGSPGKFTGMICGEAATVTVESGCVHEHVIREDVCAHHASRLVEGVTACTACWKAGHECRLLGHVVVAP